MQEVAASFCTVPKQPINNLYNRIVSAGLKQNPERIIVLAFIVKPVSAFYVLPACSFICIVPWLNIQLSAFCHMVNFCPSAHFVIAHSLIMNVVLHDIGKVLYCDIWLVGFRVDG